MAFYTSQIDSAAVRPSLFRRFLSGLARGIERQGQINSRRAQIEALDAKSDEELAAMGITRDQIAYHVFRDLYYI